jgi:hypothetical protein
LPNYSQLKLKTAFLIFCNPNGRYRSPHCVSLSKVFPLKSVQASSSDFL